MANPKYVTTTANTPSPVQVDKAVKRFWVESVDGADTVWFTVDGTAPVAMQDGTYFLPPSPGAGIPFELAAAQQVTVTFKSAVATKVAVRYL